MIPREYIVSIFTFSALLGVTYTQNSRVYDTSDWIPLTDKCPTCHQSGSQNQKAVEKEATDRVLNLAGPDRNFFPDEPLSRNKKSHHNAQQYLREVSPPAKRIPKSQELLQAQPLEVRPLPPSIRLNEGEYINEQYFRRYTEPRELPKRQRIPVQQLQQLPQQVAQQIPQQLVQQLPQVVQQIPQQVVQQIPQQAPQQQIQIGNAQPLIHQNTQILIPQGQQFIAQELNGQPVINVPLIPEGLNFYQPLQLVPQQPEKLNKSIPLEVLNPGIQAINYGLASVPNNNNRNVEAQQIPFKSNLPKPNVPNVQDAVQLVYVPLESLNQRPQQNLVPQVSFHQNEERLRKQHEQQLKIRQEQQLKAQQEFELKKQEELKAQRLKAQKEEQLKKEEEQILQQQLQEQLQALEQEQLNKLLRQQQEQLQAQEQEQLNKRLLQQQEPVQQIQIQDTRKARPQLRPQYQTRTSAVPTEMPFAHKQQQLQSIQSDFAKQAYEALRLQLQLQQEETAKFLGQTSTIVETITTTTTPLTKKKKPHQPPLAVYMGGDGEVTVSDVLNVLKSAKTISVQDNVGPNSPQVFVGPHNLEPPEGYAKFELPYLSTLENNRVERKVDQLPFFVAPLSYKAPPGYSKIALPAPHVGSVVISQKEDLHEKREQPPIRLENLLKEEPYRLPNVQPYEIEPQPRPIKPFNLENAINEDPYRLPTQPQTPLDIVTTVTTPSTPTASVRPNLLGQTINQYELEQINSQFNPQSQIQPEHESTQDEEVASEYDEVTSPRRPITRNRSRYTTPPPKQYATENPRKVQTTPKVVETRHRYSAHIRTTPKPIEATQSPVDRSKYTVLEDFSVRKGSSTVPEEKLPSKVTAAPLNTPQDTTITTSSDQYPTQRLISLSQFNNQQQFLPAGVSRLPSPYQSQLQVQQYQSQQPQINQQISQIQPERQIPEQQYQLTNLPVSPSSTPAYFLDNAGRYVQVANVDPYRQIFQQEIDAFRATGPLSTTTPVVEITITSKAAERTTESPRSNSRGNSRERHRGKTHYVADTYQEDAEEKGSSEKVKLPSDLPSVHPGLHGLINDLQDQSLRALLVPSSIAPTTEQTRKTHTTVKNQQTYVERQQQQQYVQQPQQQFIAQQPEYHTPQNQQQFQQPQLQQSQLQQPQFQQPQLQQPQYQQPRQQYVYQLQEEYGVNREEVTPVVNQQFQPQVVVSTEATPTTTRVIATTTAPTTTTTRRSRGRQRARVSTTTSTPRRTTQRTRRPTSRARTEHSRYQEVTEDYADYSPAKTVRTQTRASTPRQEADYETETTQKSLPRQRFRTRGRPLQDLGLSERTSSSSSIEESYRQTPQPQPNVQTLPPQVLPPQSYMQFEQPFDTVQTSRNHYQSLYSTEDQLQSSSTEVLPLSSPEPDQKLSVDVLINHPITEAVSREPELISQPVQSNQYVRFSSTLDETKREEENIQSTSQAPTRVRTRSRLRIKPSTHRTITTTANHITTTTEKPEQDEFYGFIRPPSFNRPSVVTYRAQDEDGPKLYSSTYVSTTDKPIESHQRHHDANYEDQPIENSNNVPVYSNNGLGSSPRVQFVGKIKSKYPANNLRHEDSTEASTEEITTTERRHLVHIPKTHTTTASKPRVRSRLRVPTRKTSSESSKPHSSESHKYKSRGVSHFQVPESVKGKSGDSDESVESENYPAPFLKARQALENPTERPKFQITIEPSLEETFSDEDQLPYSSIYQPTFLSTDGEEMNQGRRPIFIQNDIPVQRKIVESQEETLNGLTTSTIEPSKEEKNITESIKSVVDEIIAMDKDKFSDDEGNFKDYLNLEPDDATTTISSTSTTSKGRRRGVWRLIKRPLDPIETAESQYVGTIIANSVSFDKDKKDSFSSDKGHVEIVNSYSADSMKTPEEPVVTVTSEGKLTTPSPSLETSQMPEVSSQVVEVASTRPSFFDSLYKMFGISEDQIPVTTTKITPEKEEVTTNYVEVTTKHDLTEVGESASTATPNKENEGTSTSKPAIKNDVIEELVLEASTEPNLNQDTQSPNQSWGFDFNVKTSTSTEVSHETEICYRGRCVKSSGTSIPPL